jgi:hypothetical protein
MKTLRIAEYVTTTGAMNAREVLAGKSLEKRPLGIPRSCQDNIKMLILRRQFVWMGGGRNWLKIVYNGRLWC